MGAYYRLRANGRAEFWRENRKHGVVLVIWLLRVVD